MKPTKLSAQLLLEMPPVLTHFVEQDRNPYLEGIPRAGKVLLRDMQGLFVSLSSLAVQRRVLLENLGPARARALAYVSGFELGRRQAASHFDEFKHNVRLALQAPPVFMQLEGGGVFESVRFEFDLDARTLYREVTVSGCAEALAYRSVLKDESRCVCWATAGYLSGHMTEILEWPVITMETECLARGERVCRFVSKLDAEWGQEADWIREAFRIDTVDEVLTKHEEQVAAARKAEQRARSALNDLNRRLRSDLMIEGLVADAACMDTAMRTARRVMDCDVPVLEVGEPGVGRETLAKAIHYGGGRRNKPFVSVDCVGLKGQLLTQELLGYVADGIPGATRPYTGAFQRAHGGTLYLNEAAHLSLEAQVFLLRAMREGVLFPLGADAAVKADVRVVAATQYDLNRRVSSGEFLEHLYAALSVVKIEIPPLRDRGTDILRLAELFLRDFGEKYQREELSLDPEVKVVLSECAWPGNVRQLRNVIEHAVIMTEARVVGVGALPDEILATRRHEAQEELTEPVIRAALRRAGGNRTRAADLLGVGRTSLWRAMKRLRIRQ